MGESKVSGKTAQSQERHTLETDHLCWVWTQCTEDNSVPPFDDVRGSEMVFADLARKLESERDHLREQNKELVRFAEMVRDWYENAGNLDCKSPGSRELWSKALVLAKLKSI